MYLEVWTSLKKVLENQTFHRSYAEVGKGGGMMGALHYKCTAHLHECESTRFRRGDCFVTDRRSVSVFPGGIDQILAAVGQQVLLVAVDLHP